MLDDASPERCYELLLSLWLVGFHYSSLTSTSLLLIPSSLREVTRERRVDRGGLMILLLLETLVLIVHRLLLLRSLKDRDTPFKIGLWLIGVIAIFMLWGKVGINVDTYIHVAWLCTHGDLRFTRVRVIIDPISTVVLLLHVHVRSRLIAFRANFIWLKLWLFLSLST